MQISQWGREPRGVKRREEDKQIKQERGKGG
jgi:hypothetical protein